MSLRTRHLVVMRPGAIGDTLLTLPLLTHLRALSGGELQIDFVGNVRVLELARQLNVIERGFDYEEPRWSELFSARGLRHPATLELLGPETTVVGWLRDQEGWLARNLEAAGVERARQRLAPGRPPESYRGHIVSYLASTLNLRIDLEAVRKSPYRLPASDDQSGEPFPKGRFVAIHPGSGSSAKCWPAAGFGACIERCWQAGYAVLVLAGPADDESLAQLVASLPAGGAEMQLRIWRDVKLERIAHALRGCALYLGNDSGLTHLAALLGVPTIALFGPTDPATWAPLGPDVVILRAQPLKELTIGDVLEPLQKRLPKSDPPF